MHDLLLCDNLFGGDEGIHFGDWICVPHVFSFQEFLIIRNQPAAKHAKIPGSALPSLWPGPAHSAS